MKTTSNFALLDIKRGRATVRALVEDHKHKIPVTIEGFLIGDWSGDDGTSIEFEVQVTSHKLGKPVTVVVSRLNLHDQISAARRRNGNK
jgi:hypothetical protein